MRIRPILLTIALGSGLLVEAFHMKIPNRQSLKRKQKKPPKTSSNGWPKYFREPGGTDLANHYDSRYEHGVLSYEEKQNTQVHMMRAYLDFFKKNSMETWLAHGTLLGWWWNGKVWTWPAEIRQMGETYVPRRCYHGIGI